MASADDRTPATHVAAPARDALLALDADAWATLLVHIRAVLQELDDATLDRRLRQLRSSPTSRLASGRLRAELSAAVAEDRAGVWGALLERLRSVADVDDGPLGWLVRGDGPPTGPIDAGRGPDRGGSVARREQERQEQERRERTLRARTRELITERDEARRRLTGAEARAAAAEQQVAERDDQLASQRRELEQLRARLDDLDADHERALDRVRRQHEAEVGRLREELRELRRAEEERRQQRRRREAARSARATRSAPTRPARRRATGARPGRPSQLPAGTSADTAEGARALLTSGRLVLVDGYNVTRTQRDHLTLADQRTWLIKLLEQVRQRFGVQVEVVFDSATGPVAAGTSSRTIAVRFTAASNTADDEIVFAVAAEPEDRPILVVTDDRELRDRVRRHQVDVVGSGPFLWAVE